MFASKLLDFAIAASVCLVATSDARLNREPKAKPSFGGSIGFTHPVEMRSSGGSHRNSTSDAYSTTSTSSYYSYGYVSYTGGWDEGSYGGYYYEGSGAMSTGLSLAAVAVSVAVLI